MINDVEKHSMISNIFKSSNAFQSSYSFNKHPYTITWLTLNNKNLERTQRCQEQYGIEYNLEDDL